ncbi:hypothetical protein [Pseudonocardia sp. HH130630-07]|uniref:hypothetical protein n=1 Tax=Pseudonocardia sp. HH130630-07 TaxID=1690815 RepID=UPI0012E99CF7|nr:hypothetical protein [Pseudonocardia sp. HH130630-07]
MRERPAPGDDRHLPGVATAPRASVTFPARVPPARGTTQEVPQQPGPAPVTHPTM